MSKIKPNLFVVGAPKCGTTALTDMLGKHPNVFVSTPKEPHYFDYENPKLRYVDQLSDYESLFDAVSSSQSIISEASIGYLSSTMALERIYDYNKDAKIVVMLRNPVDMVYSLYHQSRFTRYENIDSFAEAWQKCEARYESGDCPSLCRCSRFINYKQMGRLGEQVKYLLKIFPVNNVFFIDFNELTKNFEKVWSDLAEFLSIKYVPMEFEAVNGSKIYKSGLVSLILELTKRPIVAAACRVKAVSGIDIFPLMKHIKSLNEKPRKYSTMRPEDREIVYKELYEDMTLLSKLTGIDYR